MGLMTPVMLPIQTTGVPLAGYLFDRQGSYTSAFLLFVGLYHPVDGRAAVAQDQP